MAGSIWAVDTFVGYQGIPLPPLDDLGCRVLVKDVAGWLRLADPSVDSTPRPYSDGTLDGQSTQGGAAYTISGIVQAPDQISLLFWCERFNALLTSGDRYNTLTATEPHLTRTTVVRRGGEAIAEPTSTLEATFSAILYAPDPLKYGPPITTNNTTFLPYTSGGVRFPMRFPFRFSATVNAGTLTVVNIGTASSPAPLRIDGPAIGPIVTHYSSGSTLTFATDYVLAAGSWLDIDQETHEVLENGQALRNEYVTSRGWFRFDKGTNVVGFSAAVYDPATLLTLNGWRPAWF